MIAQTIINICANIEIVAVLASRVTENNISLCDKRNIS